LANDDTALLSLCLVALVVASGCLAAEPASQERVDTPTTEVPYDDQSPAKPTYDE